MSKQDKASKNALLDLVDSYAKARAEAKAAEKLEQALREQVVAQFEARGVNALSGHAYDVFRTVSVRETLDSKAVRLLLTPAQIEAVTKRSSVQTLSVTARGEVVA